MTLTDILDPNSDCRLYNPQIGEVDWTEWEYSGVRVLQYARGEFRGQPLVVDWEILWGRDWTRLETRR